MGYVWDMYRIFMGYLWDIYGIYGMVEPSTCREFQWNFMGFFQGIYLTNFTGYLGLAENGVCAPHDHFNGDNENDPLELGVPYFQTKPYENHPHSMVI